MSDLPKDGSKPAEPWALMRESYALAGPIDWMLIACAQALLRHALGGDLAFRLEG